MEDAPARLTERTQVGGVKVPSAANLHVVMCVVESVVQALLDAELRSHALQVTETDRSR